MENNFDDLINTLKKVYVEHEDNIIKINPEYIYMTIPSDYVCIYNKILILLSEYGLNILNDCNASCNNRNKSIINCFNMFNSAVAARKLGLNKQAETIIKYVSSQLKLINTENINVPEIVFPVDNKGYLKAIVSCNENPTFVIDTESGLLWQQSINPINDVYVLDETDLNNEQ